MQEIRNYCDICKYEIKGDDPMIIRYPKRYDHSNYAYQEDDVCEPCINALNGWITLRKEKAGK